MYQITWPIPAILPIFSHDRIPAHMVPLALKHKAQHYHTSRLLPGIKTIELAPIHQMDTVYILQSIRQIRHISSNQPSILTLVQIRIL